MSFQRILLEASKEHTLNALALAFMNNQPLLIRNPYTGLKLERYQSHFNRLGLTLAWSEAGLQIRSLAANQKVDGDQGSASFRDDDIIGLLLARQEGGKVMLKRGKGEDFERRILILRRMGARLEETRPGKKGNELVMQGFEKAGIKFSFLPSNYHLVQQLVKIAAASGNTAELLADFELRNKIDQAVYPIKMVIENLNRQNAEDEMLAMRLRRLRGLKTIEKFHYRISREDGMVSAEMSLPADSVTMGYVAVMALAANQPALIAPLLPFENDKCFVRILNRLGADAGIEKNEETDDWHLTIRAGELAGRKIEPDLIRNCDYLFGPLAVLAAFCPGKTILRGLPRSSSLWRRRISGLSRLLSSAGIRVGEMEDGLIVEPPAEFDQIEYLDFEDPYLQLAQFAAAALINREQLAQDFFGFSHSFPNFRSAIRPVTNAMKSLAS